MAEPRAVNAVSDSFDLQQEVRRSVQEALRDYLPMQENGTAEVQSVQQRAPLRFLTGHGHGRGRMGNQPTLPPRTPDGRPICFQYRGPGHISIHCPKRGFSAGTNCTGCGGQGHVQDECLTWTKKQENQTGYATAINDSTHFSGLFDLQDDGDTVTLLVDTGSSISILHHSVWVKSPSLKSSPLNKTEFSAVTAMVNH